MKRTIIYGLFILLICPLISCKKDKVYYDLQDKVAATFAAAQLQVPGITLADSGSVAIPLYRGNKNGAVSVPAVISGGEGVFIPDKSSFDFAPGQNVAYIHFTFDYSSLGGKPEPISIALQDESMIALSGIGKTSFTLVRRLTYSKVGTGTYYSSFYDQSWRQDLYKAEEGNFYMLDNCWVKGTDFAFEAGNGKIDWYTLRPGYNYGSYGPVALNIIKKQLGEIDGKAALVLQVQYYLPEYGNRVLDRGTEYFILPEGFSFG